VGVGGVEAGGFGHEGVQGGGRSGVEGEWVG
jgi:hypothetical protein